MFAPPSQIAIETVMAEAGGLDEVHFLFLNPSKPEEVPFAMTAWRTAANTAGLELVAPPPSLSPPLAGGGAGTGARNPLYCSGASVLRE
jgi:hypothetical protein